MTTIYEAIAEPTRRRILDLLRDEPRMVNDLADILSSSQPGVSKHLRVLREVGLVKVRQDAQRRWYELRAAPLAEIDAWLESYRGLWEERFDQLDEYLIELQEQARADQEQEKEDDGDEPSITPDAE